MERSLREVVESIRREVVREERLSHANGPLGELQHRWAEELGRLRLANDYLHSLSHSVGSMPAAPDTWRARLGAHLVRIVQRMLFWYTPQILRFHAGVLEVFERECALFEQLLEMSNRFETELGQLRAEVRAGSISGGMNWEPAGGNGSVGDAFRFAWHKRTRPVSHIALDAYLDVLRQHVPLSERAPVLVVGGTVEWLNLLTRHGYAVDAADGSAAAVEWCRQMAVPVAHRDPLEFLCSHEPTSAAAVAAFGVLERFPFDRTIAFVKHAARVLQPGGILLIETVDPARLPSPAHDFWEDPGAVRPLPVSLMEFLLDYCSFAIIERLVLDPPPNVEPWPLAGLELVDRLNNHFYGPRIYALVGRL
jgi:SAM-dependent methyltransferase